MSPEPNWNQSGPRRCEPRIRAALPVRVWGMDAAGNPFVQTVATLNISGSGAAITGVTVRLAMGEIIGLQYGSGKARFRVVWTSSIDHVGYSVGLRCIDADKCLWPTQLASPVESQAGATATDRRRSVRFPCNGSVEIGQPGKNYKMWGTVTDISAGGCYVQTVSTVPPESQLELALTLGNQEVQCMALVRSSHPSIGMGMEFEQMGAADQQKLSGILQKLEMTLGDKLPPHMRVLAQVERVRENLAQLEDMLRQDPNRMRVTLPENMQRIYGQVVDMLQQQREVFGKKED